MNFVPAIPQVSQQNQGMGYGDWQQYAGFNKNNPFGGAGGLYGSTEGVKPPSQTKSTGTPAPLKDLSIDSQGNQINPTPIIDYSIAPKSNSTMGSTTTPTMGLATSTGENIKHSVYSAFGVDND